MHVRGVGVGCRRACHGPDGSSAGECQARSVPGGRFAPLGELPAVQARREQLQPLFEQLRAPLPLHGKGLNRYILYMFKGSEPALTAHAMGAIVTAPIQQL